MLLAYWRFRRITVSAVALQVVSYQITPAALVHTLTLPWALQWPPGNAVSVAVSGWRGTHPWSSGIHQVHNPAPTIRSATIALRIPAVKNSIVPLSAPAAKSATVALLVPGRQESTGGRIDAVDHNEQWPRQTRGRSHEPTVELVEHPPMGDLPCSASCITPSYAWAFGRFGP